jgi:hypothetical protein
MDWFQEVLDASPDALQRDNPPARLVQFLRSACQAYLSVVERTAAQRVELVNRMSEDQRIGERVRILLADGRTTVRLASLLDPK